MVDIKNYIDTKNYSKLKLEILKNPDNISYSFALTEDIIDEFKDILNWNGISARTENLSEEFLYKYIDRINLLNLVYTRILSGDFLFNIVNHLVKNDLDLDLIFLYQDVDDFYKNKLKMMRELIR